MTDTPGPGVLPCIRCDAPLENALGGDNNQPYAGTCFYTKGHYGSTIFDPMDDTWLELNVCDDCLRALREKGRILFYRSRDDARKWEGEG